MQDPEGAKQADAHLTAQRQKTRHALSLGEIFKGLEDRQDKPDEQVAWLKKNNSPTLRYFLRLGFDPTVEWALPEHLPPYTPFTHRRNGRVVQLRPGMAATDLFREARRVYIFLKGTNLSPMKLQKHFQALIEDLEPMEVDVLAAIKDKKLSKFVTRELTEIAFPRLFTGAFNGHFFR